MNRQSPAPGLQPSDPISNQRPGLKPIPVGLFYGSTNGDTRRTARLIQQLCSADATPWASVELLDVAEQPLSRMADYPLLILGAPTWNVGQMQRDWERVFDDFDALDLSGAAAALFGHGDQLGYPDTFADALVFCADKVVERGATLLGRWPAVGYDFHQSWALGDDGHFVGLVLDEVNQPDASAPRVIAWLAQLRAEYASFRAGEPARR